MLSANIDKNWHVYSKDLPAESGIPTVYKISSKKGIELLGSVVEIGDKITKFSDVFGANLIYFSDKVVFKQKFRPKNQNEITDITSEIRFQVCDDRVCLAPKTLLFQKNIEPLIVKNDLAKKETKEAIKTPDSVAKTPEIYTKNIILPLRL